MIHRFGTRLLQEVAQKVAATLRNEYRKQGPNMNSHLHIPNLQQAKPL